MIEVRFVKELDTPYLCHDIDSDRWHLDLPIEYFDDDERLSDIVKRASAEVKERRTETA